MRSIWMVIVLFLFVSFSSGQSWNSAFDTGIDVEPYTLMLEDEYVHIDVYGDADGLHLVYSDSDSVYYRNLDTGAGVEKSHSFDSDARWANITGYGDSIWVAYWCRDSIWVQVTSNGGTSWSQRGKREASSLTGNDHDLI